MEGNSREMRFEVATDRPAFWSCRTRSAMPLVLRGEPCEISSSAALGGGKKMQGEGRGGVRTGKWWYRSPSVWSLDCACEL